MIFTLVTGPPCSGKSSYVQKQRCELDVIIDLDEIMKAFGSPVTHGHDQPYVALAISARIAVLREIAQQGLGANVWYVTCWPSPAEQQLFPQAMRRIQMSASAEECKQRAAAASGRPAIYPALIDQWFKAHGGTRETT